MKTSLLVALALVLAGPAAGAAEVAQGNSGTQQRAVDALFAKYDEPGSPGLAVGIYSKDKPVLLRGYGLADLEQGVRITPQTVFHVASVSKQFTAFSIALLAREGKVELEADIRKYLPFVPDFGRPITVSQLVHHTSGLRDQWALFDIAGHDGVTRQQQILSLVSRQRALNFEPGSEHAYCNTGYTLLAEIVKAVSGKSFREFTTERIFRPLGMVHTFFYDDVTEIVPGRAHSYEKGEKDGAWHRALLNYDNVGATSLHTTAEDMLKWAGNFANPAVGDAELIREIAMPGKLSDGTQLKYAFGLTRTRVAGHEAVLHTGADAGFASLFAYFPQQDFAVALLMNNPGDVRDALASIADVYLNAGRKSASETLPREVRQSPAQLRAVAGDYLDDFGRRVKLSVDGIGLQWRTITNRPSPVVFRADGYFDLGDRIWDYYRLRKDDRGRVIGFDGFDPAVPGKATFHRRIEPYVATPDALQEIAGDYRSVELDITYTFSVEQGTLSARSIWTTELAVFTPVGPDRFDSPHWAMGTLMVKRDAGSRVTGVEIHSSRVRHLLFERVSPPRAAGGVALDWLDTRTSPCEDFFQYACGNWMASNPIPADESVWGTFSVLEESTTAQLRELLEGAAANPDPQMRKLGDFYGSCMDEAAIEARGVAPLRPLLERIDAARDAAGIGHLVGELHRQNIGALFDFFPWQDLDDAEMVSAEIFQGGLTLPDRDDYLKDDAALRNAFREHVAAVFSLLGASPRQAEEDAAGVLRFETGLALASMPLSETSDPLRLRHRTSRAQLLASTSHFDWNAYLQSIGSPAFASLNVAQPQFLRAMDELLARSGAADVRAYLRWRIVNAVSETLGHAFTDQHFDFFGRQLRGAREQRARWKRCVDRADRQLTDLLGRLYVEQHFRPEDKQAVMDMVAAVKRAMHDNIMSLDWMSSDTRAKALEKLAAMAAKVGYPDRWRDYAALPIDRDDFFGNSLSAAAFNFGHDIARIGRPVDRSIWFMSAPTVNAYYQTRANDISFPAGQLQPPFYYAGGDPAYNFGGVGAVIGHEISHGFDNTGRYYDGRGNLVSWWGEEDDARFREKSACLVEQYGGYSPVAGVNLDGHLILPENIADNGGSRLAYLAMQAALAADDRKPRDGFTAEQRYFLGLSQAWCSRATEETSRLRARTDVHSPPRFQVNGAVSNMPEFAAAFSCPAGSKMVRHRPCKIW